MKNKPRLPQPLGVNFEIQERFKKRNYYKIKKNIDLADVIREETSLENTQETNSKASQIEKDLEDNINENRID